ncbi:hypothetical protein MKZ38_009293 [Zalerion maritima]|uniref:Inner nuclear membrane protein SRC1 n=1 Tax=Zalerion maritima TaxID=339359 RepID=A0AAD5RTK4_9PEZI|nr:hypothetical protein MKZ38_009293 [Zalerion maritima]
MSDSDVPGYLRDDFQTSHATVPQLRSHLVAHDISFPSNAKKPALVEIFNQRLVPQRAKIRARRDTARRTSRGIVDAGSSQDSTTYPDFGDDVPDLKPPRSTTTRRTRSPRKSSRIKSEEPDHYYPPPSPSKRSTRASSRQASHPPPIHHPEPELPIDDGLRSVRKIRRRSPEIKQEEPEDNPLRRISGGGESNFSEENPFQSGSSPAPAPRSASRRKAGGTDTIRIKSNTSRRRSDYPQQIPSIEQDDYHYDEHAPVTPISDFADVEPGEEFTPDAQLELEQEQASKGESAIVRKQPQPKKKGMRFATPLWVLFTAIVSACALWYRQEKIAVGYCGLGRDATQILPPDYPVPEWAAAVLEPQCEACPAHAYCYEDFVAKCESDYILTPHPLGFSGLVPLPPTCEPDGEKVRRVKAVADKAIEELRDRRAKYECGELVNEQGEQVETPAIDEKELKETISKKRGKRMNNREFDELWEVAIGEITDRDEVEVTTQTPIVEVEKEIPPAFQTAVYRPPLSLEFRSSARSKDPSFVLLILHLRSKYRAHRAAQAQVPALVDMVLERLAAQKELGEEGVDDGWLFLPNLRDDVLRSIHSLAERERIWTRVRAVVELNSNVRIAQREGRSGEVGRAWEWIGPISGNSEAVHRRRSRLSGIGPGRPSYGPDVRVEDEGTPSKEEGRPVYNKKWDDSRPIY